jgi:hypothetical protein
MFPWLSLYINIHKTKLNVLLWGDFSQSDPVTQLPSILQVAEGVNGIAFA